jgi:hypothetical protein
MNRRIFVASPTALRTGFVVNGRIQFQDQKFKTPEKSKLRNELFDI